MLLLAQVTRGPRVTERGMPPMTPSNHDQIATAGPDARRSRRTHGLLAAAAHSDLPELAHSAQGSDVLISCGLVSTRITPRCC